MIYKYTKCESVIAKIMADANMDGTHIRITDIREWIFEAIDKIGAPMQYVKKESGVDGPILKIHDYQVPLPEDLERLDAIAFSTRENGPWIPVRSNTSSFAFPNKPEHAHPHHHPEQPMHYKPITAQCQLYGINGMKYYERMLGDGVKEDVQCFIKPGWIVFNKKRGFIKLTYKAIAQDERGYPLIPDLSSYQEAIYWYVMMKLNFPKFLRGKLGGKGVNSSSQVYTYLQQQWNFYRNQAYAEAMMPTDAEMKSIKNEWNKLVPDYDSDDVLFKSVGEEQLNYTDYYYGY